MAVWSGERIGPATTRELLEQIASGERGAQLRATVARWNPGTTSDQIDEAFQEACARAERSCIGQTEGEVYVWLRTTAHREVGRLRRRAGREVLLDVGDSELAAVRCPEPDPVDDLIEREDHEELERLARVILSGLSSRQREVVALHTRGLRRQQIAEHLDLTPRTVKRSMEQVLAAGRNELLRLAGQGCRDGEQLVARLAFGLAGPREARRAQLHLATCGRCGAMYERLYLWREHVASLLPIPVAAEAHSHLIERAIHAAGELLPGSGLSRPGGVRRHITDTVSHLREQATVTYSRAVDPTPLAGVRPGAVAAALVGCLAVGGGATYCVEQGVDPIAGIRTIASREQPDRKAKQHHRRVRLSQAATVPIATPTVPAPTPTPTAAATPPAAQPTAAPPPPQPTTKPTPPPAPQEEYEPTAVVSNGAADSSRPASSTPRKPAPAPAGGPSEFGGP